MVTNRRALRLPTLTEPQQKEMGVLIRLRLTPYLLAMHTQCLHLQGRVNKGVSNPHLLTLMGFNRTEDAALFDDVTYTAAKRIPYR